MKIQSLPKSLLILVLGTLALPIALYFYPQSTAFAQGGYSSGALTVQLLAGRDPVRIGAYPDPANQIIREGSEDWRLTLDILEPWFCCMGVKNSGWFPGACGPHSQRAWHSDWYGLDEGMVPWNEIVPHLVATGFAGVLSMHSQYRVAREQALDKVRADLAHLRRLVAAAKE